MKEKDERERMKWIDDWRFLANSNPQPAISNPKLSHHGPKITVRMTTRPRSAVATAIE